MYVCYRNWCAAPGMVLNWTLKDGVVDNRRSGWSTGDQAFWADMASNLPRWVVARSAMERHTERALPLRTIQALVARLTNGEVKAVQEEGRVYLRRTGEKMTVHLLPYQRTTAEIERVIEVNTPWPKL
jgi:hypothetical protein